MRGQLDVKDAECARLQRELDAALFAGTGGAGTGAAATSRLNEMNLEPGERRLEFLQVKMHGPFWARY